MKLPETSTSTVDKLQTLTTYLLQEPVKAAVKEALREEGLTVETKSVDPEYRTGHTEATSMTSKTGSRGASRRSIGLAALALSGLAYLIRRRSSDRRERAQRGRTGMNRDVTSGSSSNSGEGDTRSTSTR